MKVLLKKIFYKSCFLLMYLGLQTAAFATRPPTKCPESIPVGRFASIESLTLPFGLVIVVLALTGIADMVILIRSSSQLYQSNGKWISVKILGMIALFFTTVAGILVFLMLSGLIGLYEHNCRFCPVDTFHKIALMTLPLALTSAIMLPLVVIVNRLKTLLRFPIIIILSAVFISIWFTISGHTETIYLRKICLRPTSTP